LVVIAVTPFLVPGHSCRAFFSRVGATIALAGGEGKSRPFLLGCCAAGFPLAG
jgi:hypothetical protein